MIKSEQCSCPCSTSLRGLPSCCSGEILIKEARKKGHVPDHCRAKQRTTRDRCRKRKRGSDFGAERTSGDVDRSCAAIPSTKPTSTLGLGPSRLIGVRTWGRWIRDSQLIDQIDHLSALSPLTFVVAPSGFAGRSSQLLIHLERSHLKDCNTDSP
jgi:hypothetical protein